MKNKRPCGSFQGKVTRTFKTQTFLKKRYDIKKLNSGSIRLEKNLKTPK